MGMFDPVNPAQVISENQAYINGTRAAPYGQDPSGGGVPMTNVPAFGATGAFGFAGNPIGGAIGNAISPGGPAVPPPQAQPVGFWDKFNAFMGGSGPAIGQAADALSTIGMGEIFPMHHPVPDARPFIGPGIMGLQNLAQSFAGRG